MYAYENHAPPGNVPTGLPPEPSYFPPYQGLRITPYAVLPPIPSQNVIYPQPLVIEQPEPERTSTNCLICAICAITGILVGFVVLGILLFYWLHLRDLNEEFIDCRYFRTSELCA